MLQFVNGRLQISETNFLVLQRAHADRQRLYALRCIVSFLAQQTLLGRQLGRIEFEFRYLTLNVRDRFVEFVLNALNVFQQLQHRAMQVIQTGHLTAHIEIGVGQPLLFRFQIVQPIADVVVLQFVDVPFHDLLSDIQVVDLLANVTLMAHSMIGFGFNNVVGVIPGAFVGLQIERERERLNEFGMSAKERCSLFHGHNVGLTCTQSMNPRNTFDLLSRICECDSFYFVK